MTDVIEPVLNSKYPELFKIVDSSTEIIDYAENGWPQTVEATVELETTKVSDKIISQDYEWLDNNDYDKVFGINVQDDGYHLPEETIDELKKDIEEVKQKFTKKFVSEEKSNVYGRKNLVKDEIVLTDKGRGGWR